MNKKKGVQRAAKNIAKSTLRGSSVIMAESIIVSFNEKEEDKK